MHPLRFQPVFQRYLWGGRRLATVLNKDIGDHPAAESWELVDHQDGQSVVAYGPLAGQTLHQLVVDYDVDLVGEGVWAAISDSALPPSLQLRFPLLFKFLDANRDLSIQVHPDDRMARTLDPPDLGKTEAWYVLAADPGARMYVGLKDGVDRKRFEAAVEAGLTADLMHVIEPQAGDCVFVPAGTMHALGAGLLVAEIQQASNTTFRVFDWNRVGQDGKPRPLHIDQALQATDFDRGPVSLCKTTSDHSGGQTIVDTSAFTMRRLQLDQPLTLEGQGQFLLLVTISGAVDIENDPAGKPLGLGQTALIPAASGPTTVTPRPSAELLVITC